MREWLRRLQTPSVRRIINTVSNIAYPIAGLTGYVSGLSKGIGLFWATVLLAVGSSLYHWNENRKRAETRIYRLLDEIGMYAVLLALVAGLFNVPASALAASIILVACIAPFLSSTIGVGVLLAGLAWGAIIQEEIANLLPAFYLFVVAFLVRREDEKRVTEVGNGLLHAVWHLVTAAGIAYAGWVIYLL